MNIIVKCGGCIMPDGSTTKPVGDAFLAQDGRNVIMSLRSEDGDGLLNVVMDAPASKALSSMLAVISAHGRDGSAFAVAPATAAIGGVSDAALAQVMTSAVIEARVEWRPVRSIVVEVRGTDRVIGCARLRPPEDRLLCEGLNVLIDELEEAMDRADAHQDDWSDGESEKLAFGPAMPRLTDPEE